MVWLPPDDVTDGERWVKALLSDLAGLPDNAAELPEAVWDVQSGRVAEWSMNYNVYGVEVLPGGARVTFGWSDPDACSVPLDVLAAVVAAHLRL